MTKGERQLETNYAPRCVLNGLGSCLAKIDEACICLSMPSLIYQQELDKLTKGLTSSVICGIIRHNQKAKSP